MQQSVARASRRQIRDIARMLLALERRDRQHAIPAFIRMVEHVDRQDLAGEVPDASTDHPGCHEN